MATGDKAGTQIMDIMGDIMKEAAEDGDATLDKNTKRTEIVTKIFDLVEQNDDTEKLEEQ